MMQHDSRGNSAASTSSSTTSSSPSTVQPVVALCLLLVLWLVLLSLYHADIQRSYHNPADIKQGYRPLQAHTQQLEADDCETAPSLRSSPIRVNQLSSPLAAFAPHPRLKPTPESLAMLPSRCGTWMERYAAFHAHVLSGDWFIQQINETSAVNLPPPMIIYFVDPSLRLGGISDRWPPLATAMLLALLTDRAIMIDWPGYEAAYDHPNLPYLHNTTWRKLYGQWKWYKAHAAEVKAVMMYNQQQQLSGNKSFIPVPLPSPPAQDWRLIPIDNNDRYETGTHDNGITVPEAPGHKVVEQLSGIDALRALFPRDKAIVTTEQRFWSKGLARRFFANRALSHELHKLGLTESVCHGCMINFLLHINREVMEMFAPYALQLRAVNQLTVGVQIRMGDVHMTSTQGLTKKNLADLSWQFNNESLKRHGMMFMGCAEQLAAIHIQHQHQRVLFFLVSDHTLLRSMLQEHYGQRLLVIPTSETFTIGHTDIGDPWLYNASRSTLKRNKADEYLRVAAGEQWILAYNDYLVLEHEGSGFGRSAALRSLKLRHSWFGRGGRRCDGDSGMLTVEDWDKFGHRY